MFPSQSDPPVSPPVSPTLIDNIFVNIIQLLQSHKQGILYTDITDHLPIFHIVNFIEASASPYYIKKRQVNTQTIDRFKSILNSSNWNYVTSTEDTQEPYTRFHGIIQDAYNSAFPVKEIRVKQKLKHPWVSPALQISIKFKNKLYLRYRKQPIARNETRDKNYKNKLTHLLRIAERQYYQGILEENKHNLRKSWRILKDIINKNTYRKKCTEFNENGRTIKEPKSISNRFNEYFTNIGTSLANKIPNTKVTPNSFLGQSTAESILIFPTTVDEIHKCILSLQNSSPGWDNFRPDVMKRTCQLFLSPLNYIINLSFNTGYSQWNLKKQSFYQHIKAEILG